LLLALGCAGSLFAQNSLTSAGPNPFAPAAFTGSSADSFWDGVFMGYDGHGSGHRAGGGNPASAFAGPLFPVGSGAGRNMALGGPDSGSVLGTLMKFDLLGRNGSALRLNTSVGSFRLSYREISNARGPGQNGGFGQGLADDSSTSTNFSNGMFNVSATGTYGGHPVTGTLRAGSSSIGSGPGGQKHSAPSVGVKLSF
jgi:hypothetical protein